MDLTTPIDIQAVIGAVKEHRDLLTTLDAEQAKETLQHFTAIPGVKDSIVLGRTTLGKISHKYTGTFIGQRVNGKVVPRTLKVYPCVMEMEDEPERYRRTYLIEVKGGLDPYTHPFEIWLMNYGYKCASKELFDVMLVAKHSDQEGHTDLADSFDGIGAIIDEEKQAGNFSVANGNVYETGALTRANIGDKFLEMYRQMPSTFRSKRDAKLYISADLGDLYDDWMQDQGTVVIQSDTAEVAGQKFLRGTNKKVEIVRLNNMPDNSKFAMLTTKENIVYGYDKDSDFQSLVPFAAGNPYKFTAAGKYLLGFQFVTLDKSEICINDQPFNPGN